MYHHVDYCRIKTFLKACLIFSSLLFTSKIFAGAAEQWNASPRQMTIADMGMRTRNGIGIGNVKAANDMISADITQRVTVDGSNATINTKVSIPANDDSFKRNTAKHAKNLLKGGAYAAGAAAAMKVILDGVGWVIDEGSKVTRHPTPEEINPSSYSYGYARSGWSSSKPLECYSLSSCQAYAETNAASWGNGWKLNGSCIIHSSAIRCPLKAITDSSTSEVYFLPYSNPQYNPSSPQPENIEVTEAEKERVLKDLLNDPKYANLAAEMIGNTYSMGSDNPDPDPDVVNDLKNKQKDVLKSDNPKGDGKTRTDPKIDTGTQGQVDTTPKPDTGTGTNPDTGTGTTPSPNPSPNNGSTTTFELPAFCNYAAKLCDWLDWTQDDKELEEAEKEEPEELDLGTIDKNRFRANGQCPAPIQVNESVRSLGKSVDFDLTIEWTQICNVAEDTSPLVLLISTITGLLILVGGGRSGES